MEDRGQLQSKLEDWILTAFALAGQKNSYGANEIKLIRDAVLSWYFGNTWADFKFDDIHTAIQKGIYKEFGDYVTISSVEVVLWCKKWKNTKMRDLPTRIPVDKQLPPISPESQILKDDSFIEAARKKFEEKGEYRDYGNILFKALKRRGHIPLSENGYVRNDIHEKAIKMLREEKIQQLKSDAIQSRIGPKKLSELIEKMMTTYFENENSGLCHQVVKMWLTDELSEARKNI